MAIEAVINKINSSETTEGYVFNKLWRLRENRIWNETEQRWVNKWGGISKGADTEEEAKAFFMSEIGELSENEYREYESWLTFLGVVAEDEMWEEGEYILATYSDFSRWMKRNASYH